MHIGLIKLIKKLLSQNVVGEFGATELIVPLFETIMNTEENTIWLTPTHPKRIEIVDANDKPVTIGTEGYLRTKLYDHDCHDYLDETEANARIFRNGYFYTGDLAVQRVDGRVRILGRKTDVLVAKAEKIHTAPIEKKTPLLI